MSSLEELCAAKFIDDAYYYRNDVEKHLMKLQGMPKSVITTDFLDKLIKELSYSYNEVLIYIDVEIVINYMCYLKRNKIIFDLYYDLAEKIFKSPKINDKIIEFIIDDYFVGDIDEIAKKSQKNI
jgi:hypothetical protein